MLTQPELVLPKRVQVSFFRPEVRRYLLLFLLLALIPTLNAVGLRHKRLTYDEGNHYQYGMNILLGDSGRLDDSKMPFTALNALPRRLWDLTLPWNPGRWFSFLEHMRTGRYVTVLFSLWVGCYVFRWSRELYGFKAGLASLFCYVFSPNILTHSRLMTTDVYAAGMITISLYYFWKLLNSGGYRETIKAGLATGLSQLAKYTCLYLYPIFALILLFKFLRNSLSGATSLREIASSPYGLLAMTSRFSQSAIFLALSLFIINAGFLFNKTGTSLSQYSFKSHFFQNIQAAAGPWGRVPLPVPVPYVQGLDGVRFYDEPGKGLGRVYLFGKLKILSVEEGFKGYYFYAFLYKVPIATQLFLLAASFFYIRNWGKHRFWQNEIFLLCPILFFTVYFNFYFNSEFGMRFFLEALPLLFIFSGSLLKGVEPLHGRSKLVLAALGSYLVISVLSYTPHYLSYFNELVRDRKMAYKILADSNLDWGENSWYLERYLERHPETIVSPEAPTAGRIVVGVNELIGINVDPEKFRWLREHFEPVDHVAYSYLVYDVSPEALTSTR